MSEKVENNKNTFKLTDKSNYGDARFVVSYGNNDSSAVSSHVYPYYICTYGWYRINNNLIYIKNSDFTSSKGSLYSFI